MSQSVNVSAVAGYWIQEGGEQIIPLEYLFRDDLEILTIHFGTVKTQEISNRSAA